MTLTEYLDAVSQFWNQEADSQFFDKGDELICQKCEMYGGQGYCAMLHDRSIPDGNCLGLFQLGLSQPKDE